MNYNLSFITEQLILIMRHNFLKVVQIFLIISAFYGSVRLFYYFTDGFVISNIHSSFFSEENRETHRLSAVEQNQIKSILAQKFTYLGKGCQSYVFSSEDNKFVVKFLKYPRLHPKPWILWMKKWGIGQKFAEKNIEKKNLKTKMLFDSWKLAFDHLQEETGVIYAHLQKSHDLNTKLTIQDKLGLTHVVNLDEVEFILQKKAEPFCQTLEKLMVNQEEAKAKELIDRLFTMIISEYKRGFADNDHALMQNTGIIDFKPLHIDVGQFVFNEQLKSEEIYKYELFNKMFRLQEWLKEHYVSLYTHLHQKIYAIVGEEMYSLQPKLHNHAWSEKY